MHKTRSAILELLVLAITLLLSLGGAPVTAAVSPPTQAADAAEPRVTLWATHSTISWDSRDPERQMFDIPLLYLHHERKAADALERTLKVELVGLPAGAEIQIQVISRRVNVSTAMQHSETRPFVLPDHPCTSNAPCTFQWTFDATSTPSDLYTLRVMGQAGDILWQNPYPDRPDFAILDTWDVEVGTAQEQAYTVRVFYATLFPFARGLDDFDNRLPPREVTDFIERAFAPIIRETWHTQFEEWGFGDPIHPDWDPDRVVEIFITDPPFALFGGTGTYTVFNHTTGRLYPERRLWWFSSNNAFQAYNSLESAYRTLFAHEFFHMVQWNVLLATEHPTSYWQNLFIEAQGRFAPAVQYPEIELERDHLTGYESEYTGAANRFLSGRLKTSFGEMEAAGNDRYDAALYWRFLFEQYNGEQHNDEQDNDMCVVRTALEEMARHHDSNIVSAIGRTMDATLARCDGPYRSFEESQIAFARANYALRLENGRCTDPGLDACGGFYYDPRHTYVDPPLEAELGFDGSRLFEISPGSGLSPASAADYAQRLAGSGEDAPDEGLSDTSIGLTYSGAIPASYGTDLLEVHLDPALQGQPLTLRLKGKSRVARFSVQVWRLVEGAVGAKPRALTAAPEVVPQTHDGTHVYIIPQTETATCDRLALIITRVDTDEEVDRAGDYFITFDQISAPHL